MPVTTMKMVLFVIGVAVLCVLISVAFTMIMIKTQDINGSTDTITHAQGKECFEVSWFNMYY